MKRPGGQERHERRSHDPWCGGRSGSRCLCPYRRRRAASGDPQDRGNHDCLGGFGFALFLAVLFVMDIMDGRQDGANASTIALGFAAATCIALAVWSVLCGFGGAWRARWTVAGVVLGVTAGAAGYADNSLRTVAVTPSKLVPVDFDPWAAFPVVPQRRLLTDEEVWATTVQHHSTAPGLRSGTAIYPTVQRFGAADHPSSPRTAATQITFAEMIRRGAEEGWSWNMVEPEQHQPRHRTRAGLARLFFLVAVSLYDRHDDRPNDHPDNDNGGRQAVSAE
jgi:hypothetical protein